MTTGRFWAAVMRERAVKTAAQAAVALIGTAPSASPHFGLAADRVRVRDRRRHIRPHVAGIGPDRSVGPVPRRRGHHRTRNARAARVDYAARRRIHRPSQTVRSIAMTPVEPPA